MGGLLVLLEEADEEPVDDGDAVEFWEVVDGSWKMIVEGRLQILLVSVCCVYC